MEDFSFTAPFVVSVFLLLAVVLALQLGGLPAESLALMRGTTWAFALCFAAITIFSWKYFFIIPIVLSGRHYSLPDGCGMAFSQANPMPLAVCWASARVGNTEISGSCFGSVRRNALIALNFRIVGDSEVIQSGIVR